MKNKKIPVLIGMALLVIGSVAGVILIGDSTTFLPRATPEYVPQKVKISNIADNSFTVSWITQEPSIGFIELGTTPENLTETVVDDRDLLSGDSQEYRSHYITAQALEPNTTYYFKLGSQGNRLYDKNGQPFRITTTAPAATPPAPDTAYGTVYTPAQTPAQGAVVYVVVPGATPISALVKQDGNWTVSLSSARSLDLSSFASYDPNNTTLNILVQSPSGETAIATTTTANDQPVPDITIGQTYDFSDQVISTEQDLQETTQSDEEQSSILTITSPVQDQIITTTQPVVQGTAPAASTINLSLDSATFQDEIQADSQGSWQWQVPGTLSAGQVTVTASTTDDQGLLITQSVSFTVNDQAASPDNTQTSTQPISNITPSPSPTAVTSPSPSPTPVSRTALPTTDPEIPVAGHSLPTVILLIIGAFTLTAGVFAARPTNI